MNLLKKTLPIFCIVLSLNTSAQQNSYQPQSTEVPPQMVELLNELDTRLKTNLRNEDVGSISAAIISDDKIIWTQSYGFVNKDQQIPASSSTLYLIGSISKSVTGLALAKIIEQGFLKLDDPIDKYLPEIRKMKNLPEDVRLTFRHLATHTGGLSRESDLAGASEGPLENWEEKLIACISQTTFNQDLYGKYSYSNIGYGILGLAMCRAVNKPFDTLLEEFVFQPLKMPNSKLVLSQQMRETLATAYSGTRNYDLGRGYKFPNGGVYSCVDDMANFAKAQLHTDFVSFLANNTWANVQQFQIVFKETKEEKYGYGLGLTVWTDMKKKNWVYHNGTVAPGYSASLYCDLTAKVSVVILRNDKGGDDIAGIADEFLYRLAEAKYK
jgi:CubicO group peptidase (beta-lactamase class C family)